MARATFSTSGRLANLRARGKAVSSQFTQSVVSASVDLSATEVSQLSVTFVDGPGLPMLAAQLFAAGTPFKAGSSLDYGPLRFEVRSIDIAPLGDQHLVSVTARPAGVGTLRRQRGAKAWRKQTPTAVARLLCKAVGLRFVGQSSKQRAIIRRGKNQSSWAMLSDLADELGFSFFEAGGTVYFGRPTWLAKHTATRPLVWQSSRGNASALESMPTFSRSGDDAKRLASLSVNVLGDVAVGWRPGDGLVVTGVPTFNGTYMVDQVTIPLGDGQPVTVAASTPINPDPEKPAKAASSSSKSTTTSTSTRATADAFVQTALGQAGDAYVFGAEASASDADPDAFDCSELVEWALARVGVTFVDGSSNQLARVQRISVTEGINTKGALLFHPGHVAISLGNGKTIEAANRQYGVRSLSVGGRFTAAGRVPGLSY